MNNIEKSQYETNRDYERRKLIIKSISPKNEKELKSSILISYIANNILNLHCIYPQKLQQKVKNAISNIKV